MAGTESWGQLGRFLKRKGTGGLPPPGRAVRPRDSCPTRFQGAQDGPAYTLRLGPAHRPRPRLAPP